MKNSHGTGSIRKRPEGRWEARYTAPDGVQRSVYGRTKQLALEAMRKKQAEIVVGTYISPSQITVEQWLNEWLQSYTPNIKDQTRTNYESYMRNNIIPYIGDLRLTKLKPLHVQRMFNDLSSKLKGSSIKSIKTAFSSAMTAAVHYDIINVNPCSKVKIVRSEKHEMHIVDRTMFPDFIRAAHGCKYPYVYLFLLQTGIRASELRGLRWSDIDFDRKIMTIQRQLHHVKGKDVFGSPKNGHSRTLKLMDETIALLKRQKADQNQMRIAGKWIDDDLTTNLVFRQENGAFVTVETMTYYTKKIGKMIGIPELTAHDLRHSYAVAALRARVDVKTVQNNLGHASAAMTLDIYASYTEDMGTEAAEKFEQYWRENSSD